MSNTYALYITAYLLTMRLTPKKVYYPARNPKKKHLKQFKRHRGNPHRANRHIYTTKDMRYW
jgi:hypothetical protein